MDMEWNIVSLTDTYLLLITYLLLLLPALSNDHTHQLQLSHNPDMDVQSISN